MPHICIIKYPDTRVGARAYTNNLLLALVPIMHNPKTKRPNMTVKLRPSQLLGQRISNVTLSWNLAYLHTSSIDDLSNQMESPEYALGSLV